MKVKFAPDLFLEVAELNKFKESLDEQGFRKMFLENSESFGLIKNLKTDPSFGNAKVERDTDLGGDKTIKIAELFGVDSLGELLYSAQQTQIVIPNDGNWYWVKVSHAFSTRELGLINIAANGDLTGVGTEFLSILRGQPNFPSRIKFLNSVSNTQEYDIQEVVSDTQAILLGGPFSVETDLKFAIVGTFTPGITVPTDSKYPFQYDGVITTLVAETTLNTRPTYTVDQEFFLARVKRVGADLVIQDKRIEHYKTKASNTLTTIDIASNPLLGIEAVRFNHPFSPRDRNIVDVSWVYRSSNFTLTSNSNVLTLSSGEGGRFESNTQVTSGDFDGWRCYTADGKYSKIISSIKSGSNVNLTLDVADVDSYSTDGGTTWLAQELLITPDCEEIELRFIPSSAENLLTLSKTYPINTRLAKVELLAYQATSEYTLNYRYKTLNTYTEWTVPEDDGSPYGFLTEASFDDNGDLDSAVRAFSTAGVFELTQSPDAYSYTYLDKDGIEYFVPDFASSNEITHFEVKTNLKYQILGAQNSVPTVSFTRNYYLNLKTTNAQNGSEFFINIDADVDFVSYTLNIHQGYVNSGSRGTALFSLDKFWTEKALDKTITLHCKYDGTYWEVMPIISYNQYDTNIKGRNVRGLSQSLTTAP